MNTPEKFKCKHRHNGLTHGSCYRAYQFNNGRIAYLDIETSNLDANFGLILSWCIKEEGKEKIYSDVITKADLKTDRMDKRITQSLVDCLEGFDWVITYYGTGFDIPYIRSKALRHNIIFPEYKSIKHIDLYYVARSKLKLSSNRLATVTKFLGIEGKTHIDGAYWIKALSGDEKSLRYILDHNKWDVIILEKLHRKLAPFMAFNRRSI